MPAAPKVPKAVPSAEAGAASSSAKAPDAADAADATAPTNSAGKTTATEAATAPRVEGWGLVGFVQSSVLPKMRIYRSTGPLEAAATSLGRVVCSMSTDGVDWTCFSEGKEPSDPLQSESEQRIGAQTILESACGELADRVAALEYHVHEHVTEGSERDEVLQQRVDRIEKALWPYGVSAGLCALDGLEQQQDQLKTVEGQIQVLEDSATETQSVVDSLTVQTNRHGQQLEGLPASSDAHAQEDNQGVLRARLEAMEDRARASDARIHELEDTLFRMKHNMN